MNEQKILWEQLSVVFTETFNRLINEHNSNADGKIKMTSLRPPV